VRHRPLYNRHQTTHDLYLPLSRSVLLFTPPHTPSSNKPRMPLGTSPPLPFSLPPPPLTDPLPPNTIKQSASSYGLSALFPVSSVHFPASSRAAMRKWTRTTFQGKTKECWFCGTCGTRLYHYCPGAESLTVKAGSLLGLDEGMLAGGTHIWVKVSVRGKRGRGEEGGRGYRG
jgi:hypothetical protein